MPKEYKPIGWYCPNCKKVLTSKKDYCYCMMGDVNKTLSAMSKLWVRVYIKVSPKD